MKNTIATSSTNVRVSSGAPALVAWALWGGFVTLLEATGGVLRIADDIALVAGFAASFALLAYSVDAELRAALDARSGRLVAALAATLLAACAWGPQWMLLAALPAGCVMGASAAARLLPARLSSAAAASPGASRGGP